MGISRVAAQLVASRVVLSSTELVRFSLRLKQVLRSGRPLSNSLGYGTLSGEFSIRLNAIL
jgi:hypothetical protein